MWAQPPHTGKPLPYVFSHTHKHVVASLFGQAASGTRRSSFKYCLTFPSLCVGAQMSVLIMRSGHHDSCTRSSNSSCDPYGYACRCVRQRGHTKVNLSISRVHRNKVQRCSLRTNGISSRVYGSILISGLRVKSEMPPCR